MLSWVLLAVIGCMVGLALVGGALWLAVAAERRRDSCLPSQIEQPDYRSGTWSGDGGGGFHDGGGGGHH